MADDDDLDIEVVEDKKEKNHFDDVSTEQYVRYCIFEEYIRSEFRGEVSIRMMDSIFKWIWDQKVPRDPKDKSHLQEVT